MAKLWWQTAVRNAGGKTEVTMANKRKLIVPSDYYPVNGKREVFTFKNCVPVDDEKILEAFDEVQYKIGYCYQNTLALVKKLKEKGIEAKPYVGWLFTGNHEYPVHHCWCVVDQSVLDLSDNWLLPYSPEFKEFAKQFSDSKEAFASFMKEAMKMENHVRCQLVGLPSPSLYYVGTECDPEKGIEIWQNLLGKYPLHECQRNCDSEGFNKTQRYLQKMGVM